MKSTKMFILSGLAAIGSTLALAATATASNLVRVTIESIAPSGGPVATFFWLGFHNGGWNTFDPGVQASTGIEHIAEDGFTGIENQLPGFEDFDFSVVPIPNSETISSLFAGSTDGVQAILSAVENPLVGFFPGQANSIVVDLGSDPIQNRFFSYASMYFPSNDGFMADLDPLEIFDSDGNFIGADFIISGGDIWDAGTEVNDEVPANIPFTLAQINQGVDEGGVILPHPGLLPAGTGGILPVPPFFDNNTSTTITDDLPIVRIRVERVPEPSTAVSLLALGGVSLLGRLLLGK
jgi:hypothetical protein